MGKVKRFTKPSRRVERNILTVYACASPEDKAIGLSWYADARAEAAIIGARYGVPTNSIIGVIAALSPGLNWGLNVIQAEELIRAFVKGEELPIVGVYGRRNVEKCRKLLTGARPSEVLGGQKVKAFYECIDRPNDTTEVVIDRHAKALAYGWSASKKGFASANKSGNVGAREYVWLSTHYKRLAERLGILPHQLQATTWHTWRCLQGQAGTTEVPF